VSQGGNEGLVSSERQAAEFEGQAEHYERAAEQAAGAGHQRRARQLLQSALVSRKLAAEARRQTPALLNTFRDRTESAGRGLAQSALRETRRLQRETAARQRMVRRWLRKLRSP
jgi:hypothetical protein